MKMSRRSTTDTPKQLTLYDFNLDLIKEITKHFFHTIVKKNSYDKKGYIDLVRFALTCKTFYNMFKEKLDDTRSVRCNLDFECFGIARFTCSINTCSVKMCKSCSSRCHYCKTRVCYSCYHLKFARCDGDYCEIDRGRSSAYCRDECQSKALTKIDFYSYCVICVRRYDANSDSEYEASGIESIDSLETLDSGSEHSGKYSDCDEYDEITGGLGFSMF
jgi:hypothetical protein